MKQRYSEKKNSVTAESDARLFDGSYLRSCGAPKYSSFGALNSSDGFVDCFDELIGDRCDRVLLIKGGPGTGKSRLLRELGTRAEAFGARVEYYFCSSDPGSLDGMVALMPDGCLLGARDATAPHTAEAVLPGARDTLFDLGVFWREDVLAARRDEIEALSAQKSRAWTRAFDHLAVAGRLKRSALELARSAIDIEKLRKAAARAVGDAMRGSVENIGSALSTREHDTSRVLCSPHLSLGMKGAVSLGGIYEASRAVYFISNELLPGVGSMFIDAVAELATRTRRNAAVKISPDPVYPKSLCAVSVGDYVFSAERDAMRRADNIKFHSVGMRRFILPNAQGELGEKYMRSMKISNLAVDEALRAMSEAAEHHFKLEKIYSEAMDFSAKEAACAELAEKFYIGY